MINLKLREEKMWYSEDVRTMCVNHHFYTHGDIRAYERMLNSIEDADPTIENIFTVAADIVNHTEPEYDEGSHKWNIEHVMFLLNKEVIITTYVVDYEITKKSEDKE